MQIWLWLLSNLRPLIVFHFLSSKIRIFQIGLLMISLLPSSLGSFLGFPCGSAGKECAWNAGDLGWEDPLEKGKATHSSILTWRIPWPYSSWDGKELDMTERLSLSLSGLILNQSLSLSLSLSSSQSQCFLFFSWSYSLNACSVFNPQLFSSNKLILHNPA